MKINANGTSSTTWTLDAAGSPISLTASGGALGVSLGAGQSALFEAVALADVTAYMFRSAIGAGDDGSVVLGASSTRPSGLATGEEAHLFGGLVSGHADDAADSSIYGIRLWSGDALGASYKVGLRIGGANWATGIQLDNSVTFEWGTGSEWSAMYDGTDLVFTGAATSAFVVSLGTATSATKWQVKDGAGLVLLSVDGAGTLTPPAQTSSIPQYVRINLTTTTPVSSTWLIPANAIVDQVAVNVGTLYDGAATLIVGWTEDPDGALQLGDVDLTSATYQVVPVFAPWHSVARAIRCEIGGTPTVGACSVLVRYCTPAV